VGLFCVVFCHNPSDSELAKQFHEFSQIILEACHCYASSLSLGSGAGGISNSDNQCNLGVPRWVRLCAVSFAPQALQKDAASILHALNNKTGCNPIMLYIYTTGN